MLLRLDLPHRLVKTLGPVRVSACSNFLLATSPPSPHQIPRRRSGAARTNVQRSSFMRLKILLLVSVPVPSVGRAVVENRTPQIIIRKVLPGHTSQMDLSEDQRFTH